LTESRRKKPTTAKSERLLFASRSALASSSQLMNGRIELANGSL